MIISDLLREIMDTLAVDGVAFVPITRRPLESYEAAQARYVRAIRTAARRRHYRWQVRIHAGAVKVTVKR